MKKYLTMMAAAFLLAACQSEEAVDVRKGATANQDGAITFGVAQVNNTTRAVGMFDLDGTTTALGNAGDVCYALQDYGIGVFASYTGRQKYNLSTVRPDFMYNQKVTYITGTSEFNGDWTYEPVKYWPSSNKEYESDLNNYAEYLTFFAYAPYVDPAVAGSDFVQCIYGMSAKDAEGDPWVAYQLSEDPFNQDPAIGQVDLMYGVNGTTDQVWMDMQKSDITDVNDNFEFTMKHALGCVGDKIDVKISTDLATGLADPSHYNAKVYLESVVINYKNLTAKAKLILNSDGTPKWEPIISGDYRANREVKMYFSEKYIADADYVADPGDGSVDALRALSFDPSYDYIAYQDWLHDPARTGLSVGDVTVLEGKGLLYIPLELGDIYQTAEITVNYQVLADDCEPYFGTATRSVPLFSLYNGITDGNGDPLKEDGGNLFVDIVLGDKLEYATTLYPKVGDPYFSDGTWGANEHAYGAVPIGVVGYIGNDIPGADHGLIISIRDARMPNYDLNSVDIPDWVKDRPRFQYYVTIEGLSQREAFKRWYANDASEEDLDRLHTATYFSHGGIFDGSAFTSYSAAYDDVEGEKHTKAMLTKWYATGSENLYPRQDAAYLCSQYEDEGVGAKGNWYMGSFGEWIRIIDACAERSGVAGAGDLTSDVQSDAVVPVTTYDPLATDFPTGRYYITDASDEDRLLMPASGNLQPTKGINNWIQIAATHFAPDKHNIPYDMLGMECTYWTSSQAADYYSYVFRLQYEQQCVNLYGNNDPRAHVEKSWEYRENCRVRPLLKF